jgi:hypothetical protein
VAGNARSRAGVGSRRRARADCALPGPQARGRTGEAIGRLCQLAPPTALLLEAGGGEREVPAALLHRGDLVKVGGWEERCWCGCAWWLVHLMG